MNWIENIEEENWRVAPEDIDELNEDEISLREAAFMRGYEESARLDFYEEEEDWD